MQISLVRQLCRVFIFTGLLLFPFSLAHSKQQTGTKYPLCQGRNLIDELKISDPLGYSQLQASASKSVNSDGVFWRITKQSLPPSYLLGSFHSTDSAITNLPLEAQAALNGAETIVVEIANLDTAAVQLVMKQRRDLFVRQKGPHLNQLLSKSDYAQVLSLAKKAGTPTTLLPLLQPWFVNVSYFALPLCESIRIANKFSVLDEIISQHAVKNNKQLVGLESMAEQYEAFAAIPLEHQLTLLEDGIDNFSRMTDLYVTSRDLYLSGKIGYLMPMTLFFARDRIRTRAALVAFKEHLIVRRNKRMLKRSLHYLSEGNVFMAVGALHLNGRQGLVALLRQSGFKVEKVF